MEFRILGPLALTTGEPGVLGGNRERKILAALILLANQSVTTDFLIDVIWQDSPPHTARQQVQNCVGAVRSRLRRHGVSAEISRRSTSYRLQIAEDQADVLVFRRLCEQADEFAARGDIDAGVARLQTALDLWQGHVLEDVDSAALAGHVTALEEDRIRAIELYVRLEMSRRRARAVLPGLSGWARQYPYHEGLHCSLAEALRTAGRTADAVQVLHELRRRLRDDLGIEAGTPVLELGHRLLGRPQRVRVPAVALPAGTLPAGTLPAGTLPAGTLPAGSDDLVRTIESAMSSLSTVLELLTREDRLV
ncbi:AfsR/SARP family transcriptional regulator [Actinoplanes sp. NPDC049316]|uniref:AfsR/SARP family transcriptional regulator n=1 Tax=Actinoplanes sp. NPDC049316 TaxID=3154727 RepID=UPI003426B5A4